MKFIYHYIYCRSLIDSICNTVLDKVTLYKITRYLRMFFKFILYFYHFDSHSLKLWIPMESMIYLLNDNLYNL